jgi:hypothetical protein
MPSARQADRERAEVDQSVAGRYRFVPELCDEGTHCGVLAHAARPDFRARFREKVCAQRSAEDCQRAFDEMLEAEVTARYFAADALAVRAICQRFPQRCETPAGFERQLAASHNEAIDRERERLHADIQARERAAAVRERVAALTLFRTLLGQRTLSCETYPSVYGTSETTCFELNGARR